jgi:hypothetical protein
MEFTLFSFHIKLQTTMLRLLTINKYILKVFATMQTHMNLLSVHCHEFVNDVGELIMHMIIDGMHENMGIEIEDNNDAYKWTVEIEEDPNAVKDQKNEKLKKLNENFIEEVKKMYNLTKLQERPEADRYMDEIKCVASSHRDLQQQLQR